MSEYRTECVECGGYEYSVCDNDRCDQCCTSDDACPACINDAEQVEA